MWRSVFTVPANQTLLSAGALLTVGNIIDILVKYRVIDAFEGEQSKNILKRNAYKDLTESAKSFHWRFIPLGEQQTYDKCRLGKLLAICEARTLQLDESDDAVLRVRHYISKFYEADRLLNTLRLGRNVATHELGVRQDFGWCLLIPSTVLRSLEVCDFPSGADDQIESLRKHCISIIRATLQKHVLSTGHEGAGNSGGQSEENDTRNQLEKSITSFILDKIQNYIIEEQRPTDVGTIDYRENRYEEYEIESEPVDSDDTLLQVDTISPDILRQRLLGIKRDIESIHTHEADWPGPEANVMQHAVVNDVILHKPRSLGDWKRMPDTAWRYQKHKQCMDAQLELHWPAIQELIVITVWAEDD